MKSALSKRTISTNLKALHEDWVLSTSGTSITRKYTFKSYMAGFMFVTKTSVHAQVALHYPEITLAEKSVKITLTTKDVKALTKADFELASRFDSLYTLSTVPVVTAHNHY